eukprot:ANDGO_00176.mRNA.1 hypothetical protein
MAFQLSKLLVAHSFLGLSAILTLCLVAASFADTAPLWTLNVHVPASPERSGFDPEVDLFLRTMKFVQGRVSETVNYDDAEFVYNSSKVKDYFKLVTARIAAALAMVVITLVVTAAQFVIYLFPSVKISRIQLWVAAATLLMNLISFVVTAFAFTEFMNTLVPDAVCGGLFDPNVTPVLSSLCSSGKGIGSQSSNGMKIEYTFGPSVDMGCAAFSFLFVATIVQGWVMFQTLRNATTKTEEATHLVGNGEQKPRMIDA